MIQAEEYGLPSRIKLRKLDSNTVAIVKKIKSRIIQKDAAKVVEMAETIRAGNPSLKVALVCSPNICSKSVALLKEQKIDVIIEA